MNIWLHKKYSSEVAEFPIYYLLDAETMAT